MKARSVSGSMQPAVPSSRPSLRVLCLEDNPLIALHLEQMIEDFGHVFVATLESFSDLKSEFDRSPADCVLVDIDLADGRTGIDAARWLSDRGVAALFVTGQEQLAINHGAVSVGLVAKPVRPEDLRSALEKLAVATQA